MKLPFTANELNALYFSYNEQYFDGRLAKAQVAWQKTPVGLQASTKFAALGWSIWLDPIWFDTKQQVKETLLHEMCHVDSEGEIGHGPFWQRSMMMLYHKGERWDPRSYS